MLHFILSTPIQVNKSRGLGFLFVQLPINISFWLGLIFLAVRATRFAWTGV